MDLISEQIQVPQYIQQHGLRVDSEIIKNINDFDKPINPVSEHSDLLLFSPKELKNACDVIDTFIKDRITILNPNVLPVLKLRMLKTYIQFHKHNDNNEFDSINASSQKLGQKFEEDYVRIKMLSEEETEFSKEQLLPSMGLEIEVDSRILSHDSLFQLLPTLQYLGFSSNLEENLSEIIFPPSYSWRTQARMLEEFRQLHIIPFDHFFSSMHINLGFDSEVFKNLSKKGRDDEKVKLLNSIAHVLTYAYVPPNRIASRDYSLIYRQFDLNAQKGNIDKIHGRKTMRAVRKNGTDSVIEFRTPRAYLAKTYRALSEMQQLGILISTLGDHRYEDIREEFITAVEELQSKYDLNSEILRTNPKKAADKVSEGVSLLEKYRLILKSIVQGNDTEIERPDNIIDDARRIMKTFSHRVKGLNSRIQGTKRNVLFRILDRLSELNFQ